MSITISQRPDYAVAFPLVDNHDFPLIWMQDYNAVSFQLQWTGGLATGILTLMGSNQDISNTGTGSAVTYPPPLHGIPLATIDVSMAPYVTNHFGGFDVVTAYAWVWIEYTGSGGGSLSIAQSGKSYG